jgi:hypothetical protein
MSQGVKASVRLIGAKSETNLAFAPRLIGWPGVYGEAVGHKRTQGGLSAASEDMTNERDLVQQQGSERMVFGRQTAISVPGTRADALCPLVQMGDESCDMSLVFSRLLNGEHQLGADSSI